jgi:pimeloyl-ACP methyl ester carboxylesterase
MKTGALILFLLIALPCSPRAQTSPTHPGGPPLKTTFVQLSNNANAILVEPVTPIPAKARIALLIVHPEHVNTFSYFTGLELPKYGYRAMMMNYYGPETSYYEFIAPIAAAIRKLRSIPGVEKVVLVGHSTGGPELTSYQDVAENGAKACQGPERIYKCDGKTPDNLPKADGVVVMDPLTGAFDKTVGLNPAVAAHNPLVQNPALDIYSPKNGYDAAVKSASYSPTFLAKFFAAQGARANRLTDEAVGRLAKIEAGRGVYKDDEPFVVSGASFRGAQGTKPDGPDTRLLSRSHAPHLLLKADGSQPREIIHSVGRPSGSADQNDRLNVTTANTTVRHYLTFDALRVTKDYRETEDDIPGVVWRSSPNSLEGNFEGIRIPTLIMTATCTRSLVLLEIAYDLSAAKDKEFAGVEGADHNFEPCKPEYGDTYKRAFDFVDGWLSKPGRF